MLVWELAVAVKEKCLEDEFDPEMAQVASRVETARTALEEPTRRREMIGR
jgi:hypothetical protein